uniref:Legumain prodomain domain-containing protein n=1 Tax=Solanum lycopersicum TaxID=4081 RepID=A0A3Q7HN78_SOLLC
MALLVDVCHAYQVLKAGGLKEENIIVFMYDDIANNTKNPRPGVIINNRQGHDVYKGVPKDYVGDDVNAKNLFNVILANKSGVVGGSAMPSGELIYADELFNMLKKKHASGTYDRLVIYLEACESGSMFDGILPKGLNIYAMTASKPDENSFATYCGDGTPDHPCFGPCSLPEFKVAKRTAANLTYGSHVMQYGDLMVSFDPLATYMGENFKNHSDDSVDAKSFSTSSSRNVDQRNSELFYLFTKHQKALEGSDEKYEALVKLNKVKSQRSQVDNNVKHLGELLFGVEKGNEVLNNVRPAGKPLVDNWDCLKSYVKIFEAHCGRLTTYGRRHVRGIANICNAEITNEKMHQNAPEDSYEKYEALVKLNEVMSQRSQVDKNVKHLGELLLGVEKGNEVLNSVRTVGQPLVDNRDCFKSYVRI